MFKKTNYQILFAAAKKWVQIKFCLKKTFPTPEFGEGHGGEAAKVEEEAVLEEASHLSNILKYSSYIIYHLSLIHI